MLRDGLAYPGLISLTYGSAWAIQPEKLAVIDRFLRGWMAGQRLSAEEIEQRIGAAKPRTASQSGAITILPLFGIISQRANMLSEWSGGTSIEKLTTAFRDALNDPNVSAIVLDIDSPGGSVSGVEELASEILAARGQKRIVSIANSFAASAAYWLGSAADEFIVTPSGEVGSIGVYMLHTNFAEQNKMLGMEPVYISAGKYKVEGNPDAPLSPEARDYLQSTVEDYYDTFTKAVAKARNVKKSDVVNGFGEGRVVTARRAVDLGMADRVATLDQVIHKLGGARAAAQARARELDLLGLSNP